jgi:D-serine deaminase-like pyridoxal phosphate-dependent protein
MTKLDLDTPALLVDWDKLQANIARMQKTADAAGVKLRPHTKTHKTPAIAHLQLRAGARGITVAKLGEAEVMAAAGIDDILVAYPLQGAAKMTRLMNLAERVRVRVSLDSMKVAADISDAAAARGRKIPVLVEVDTGLHRVGMAPGEETREFVRDLVKLPGIEFVGLLTHAGQGYSSQGIEQVAEVGRQEGELMVESAERIRADGIQVQEVSVGSTPTAPYAAQVKGVTEIRPGNYVFFDSSQLALHSCTPDDVALTILATVVVKHPGRLVFDAGSKAMSSDRLGPNATTYGEVRNCPHLEIWRLSEEHAGVRPRGEGPLPEIGDKVEIIPNHACVVMNLHDKFYALRGDQVIGEFPILGRGKSQ